LIGRIEQGFQVRPDLCRLHPICNPRSYLGRFYVDSLVHDADTLRNLVRLVGADRVALGSDYPFPLGEAEPGRLIESMDWSVAEKERLLAGTAREFLGLAEGSRYTLLKSPSSEAAHDLGSLPS
jgi:aminocarboxymuconate-semialdehyde decarboxylase